MARACEDCCMTKHLEPALALVVPERRVAALAWVAACLTTLAIPPGAGQAAVPQRVRGSIESVASSHMVVNDRSGVRVDIELTNPLTVLIALPADRAAVAVGRSVALVVVQALDGTLRTEQALVLPDSIAAARDGGIAWDLKPENVMIGGQVTAINDRDGVRQLTIGNRDGSKIVILPAEAAVAAIQPATVGDLQAGETVFLVGTTGADGTVSAGRVIVRKNGVKPAM
jgi:hypothetical protein